MDKPITYLMDLEIELNWLAGLCDVLGAAGESNADLSQEAVGQSFYVLRSLLSAKAAETGKVVEEFYATRTGEPVKNP